MIFRKNLLFVLLLTGTQSLIYSYAMSIKNESSHAIKITMIYAGGSIICPNVELEIKSGETRNIESGACCASSVTMLGLEGIIKGKSFTYYPPVTGFGISCRNFSVVIKETADGKLIGMTV